MLWVAKKFHISLGVEMFQYKLAIEKNMFTFHGAL